MNVELNNFIGIYSNAVDPGLCDQLTAYYTQMELAGYGSNRQQRENVIKSKKDDIAIFTSSEPLIRLHSTRELMSAFNNILWNKCINHYLNEYSVLTEGKYPLNVYESKIQKTKIGGGYHIWHYETSSPDCARRVLVYCLYLNNVDEGGETEFLYIPKRIKATKGTIVIFPGSFTHTHRGNPPISNDKYLLNGWIEI